MKRLKLTPILALVLSAHLMGCSAHVIRQQSYVAEGIDEVTERARVIVLEMRADELRDAGRRAIAEGRDVRAEVTDVAQRFDDGPVLVAYNLVANLKNAYVRALLLALHERRPGFAALIPIAADLARAWTALRDAMGARGADLPSNLIDEVPR